MRFPTMWYMRPAEPQIKSACSYAQSDRSLYKSLEHSITVELLTIQYLEFLSVKEDHAGSSVSILVKMPHGWKPHVVALKQKTFLHSNSSAIFF